MEITDFEVGQTVFCYSFGTWYPGRVAKIGRTRLYVTYTTGSGKTRTKPFPIKQISLEKLEGARQQIERRRTIRIEPEMEERRLVFTQVEAIRLLCAFQAMYMPSKFYHATVTHKRARQIIEAMTGIRLKRSAKPPGPGGGLEVYMEWANNPDVQEVAEMAV